MLEESEDYKEEGEKLTEFSSEFVSVMDKYIGDLVYAESDGGWRGEVLPISYLCIGLFCKDNWKYLSENDLNRLSILYTGKERIESDELYKIVMTEQLFLLQEIQSKGYIKTEDCLVQGKKTFDAIFKHTESEVARLNSRVSIPESEYQEYQNVSRSERELSLLCLTKFSSNQLPGDVSRPQLSPQLPLPPQKPLGPL